MRGLPPLKRRARVPLSPRQDTLSNSYRPKTIREGVSRGAYVIEEDEDADITLIDVGAELGLAIDAAAKLRESDAKVYVRVVSFPPRRLFEQQPWDYRHKTLRRGQNVPAIVIEPYAVLGWK